MKIEELVGIPLNAGLSPDYIRESFLRSMGGEKPIASTGDMANFGTCFFVNLRQLLKEQTPHREQAFGTTGEIAKYFGRNPNSIRDWLRKLENQGRINPIQGTPLREGAKGDTLYKFAEVEAALREERINNKRKEQTA